MDQGQFKTPKTENQGMDRRSFLAASACVAVGFSLPAGQARTGARHPLVVRRAKAFVDGAWKVCDMGVSEEGRLVLGQLGLEGERVIDGEGRIVAPGFIDILGDNRKGTFKIFEKYKITDGVTTVLQMHGGASDAHGYYEAMARHAHWTNYGVSTFATQIRSQTLDVGERLRRIERCLEDGALGVSYSLEYAPMPYRELVQYARLAKRYDRPVFLHLRYSSPDKELSGVKEALDLARDTGARIHIDHLHSTGGTHRMAEALDMIRKARGEGFEITCCVYPYSYWATYPVSERFAPGWQQRFGLNYQDLMVVGTGERLTEASFAKYRKMPGLLVAVPEGTMPMARTVDLALKEDFCMIGSDGGIESEPRANSHPRGAGCFATSLRYALDHGMPLERMIEKMSVLPRRLLRPNLEPRGILADGAAADLVVFDPATVRSNASVSNPNQFSTGIESVIVNGRLAYHKGKLITQNGRPILAGR
jgi:N-acyl-D-aspartate/D-glutamate deacylase